MTEITDKMRQAIKETLPAQVADALKERIEDLENKEIELEQTVTYVNNIKGEYEALLKENKKTKEKCLELEKSKDSVEMKKKELDEKLINLHLKEQMLILKEKFADEKCELMMTMYKIPFANQVPVKSYCIKYGSYYHNQE